MSRSALPLLVLRVSIVALLACALRFAFFQLVIVEAYARVP